MACAARVVARHPRGEAVRRRLPARTRPHHLAFRSLAAAALLATIAFPFSAPAGAHIGWLDFVSSVSSDLALGALVFFAINYPDDRPGGWRAILKRYYPWMFGVQVLAEVVYFAQLYTGSYEPAFRWIFRIYEVTLPALFFVTFVATWRQARGESKVRLQWIIATLGVMMATVLFSALNRLAEFPIAGPDNDLILNDVFLGAMLGLFYAILRQRIFDFGLAVNRTLVIAIVGAILLGVFQIAHAVVGRYLQFGDRNGRTRSKPSKRRCTSSGSISMRCASKAWKANLPMSASA